jgi:SAM-dependent methyltransferase
LGLYQGKIVKQTLVQYLRDPVTGEPLSLIDAATAYAESIEWGVLRAESGAMYPIVEGVPVLLCREMLSDSQKGPATSFSFTRARATNYTSTTNEDDTQGYLDRYGFEATEGLASFLAAKTMILDAGSARRRYADLYARNSRATVFGIDISHGILNAYRDLGHIPNLHWIQADVANLPFPKGSFDFIGCDEGLHHTPDTRASLNRLLEHLAPGGHIAFRVDKRNGPVREFCDDHIREQTVKMSPEECLKVSEAITRLGKALSELRVTIDIPEEIPILGIRAGKQDLQRFISWNMLRCHWDETLDWESNVIKNFDWYHPLFAHRHTPEEVKGWCEEAGLLIRHFDVEECGISVLGEKPDAAART